MRFSQEARRQVEDEKNRGLNCRGCLFDKQKAAVCRAAEVAARRLGLRDCDAVDPFGEVVIYVPYREVQLDMVDSGS
jgi:hypothetical protein